MLWEGALGARMQEEEGDTTISVAKSGRYLISTRFVTNASSKSMHASIAWTNFGIIVAIFLQLGWLKLGHVMVCVKIC